MSSPDNFNDPYDSAVYFNTDRFITEDRSPQGMIFAAKELEKSKRAGIPFRPEPLKNPIQLRAWREKVVAELLGNKTAEDRDKFIHVIDKFFQQHNKQLVEQMTVGSRSGFSVLSLSENPTSVLMWSHYSDNHRGFCIEYDFEALPRNDLRKRLCFPVFYRRKLTDATRYIARTDARDFNNLFGQYLCLLKSDEWQYEKEWRLVYAIGQAHANFELPMPTPSAIILAAHTRKADAEKIGEYCTKNRIALKKVIHITTNLGSK